MITQIGPVWMKNWFYCWSPKELTAFLLTYDSYEKMIVKTGHMLPMNGGIINTPSALYLIDNESPEYDLELHLRLLRKL
jgi:hypothetical protein